MCADCLLTCVASATASAAASPVVGRVRLSGGGGSGGGGNGGGGGGVGGDADGRFAVATIDAVVRPLPLPGLLPCRRRRRCVPDHG